MKNSRSSKTGISAEAKEWSKRLVEEYEISDEAGRLLLQTAMESFDRMREAQAVLAKDGIIIEDRFGQKKQHPATLVERDAKTALLRSLKALNLDIEPPGAMGRPAGR